MSDKGRLLTLYRIISNHRAHQEFHKAPQIIVPQLLPAAEQSHRCPIAGEAILQGKQHATTNPVQQQLGSALVLLDQASESLTQRTCEPHSGTTTLNTKLDSNKEVHVSPHGFLFS